MVVDEENKKHPGVSWTPILHQHPSKTRSLIATPQCSVIPLSKALTSELTLLYKQIETYNTKMHYFSGVKSF